MKYTIFILLYSTLVLVNSVHSLAGGGAVQLGAFPSHALVLVTNVPQGGTIINANHVLTSCGTVLNNQNELVPANQILVRVGGILFNEGTAHPVVAVFPHPEYNPWSFNNDVAVLRTGTNFVFSTVLPNPPIAPANLNERVLAVGTNCFAVGFNPIVLPGAPNPPLQSLAQPILNRDVVCNAPTAHNGNALESMICAGTIAANLGVCPSSRGGGLYCNGYLTGVISSGLGCGAANTPGLYSQVRNHIQWINNQLTRTQIPIPGATPKPGIPSGTSAVTVSSLVLCVTFLLRTL